MRNSLLPWYLEFDGQALQIGTSLVVDDAIQVVLAWRAEDPKDVVQLIQVVFPGKDRSVREHFGEDATNAPDVYRLRVPANVELLFQKISEKWQRFSAQVRTHL